MISEKDQELIAKAADCAALLSADLQALASADNLLLGEMAETMLNNAMVLSAKLARIRYVVAVSDIKESILCGERKCEST